MTRRIRLLDDGPPGATTAPLGLTFLSPIRVNPLVRRQLLITAIYGLLGLCVALALEISALDLGYLMPWLVGVVIGLTGAVVHLAIVMRHAEQDRFEAIDRRHSTTLSEISAVRGHISELLAEVEAARSQQQDRLKEMGELKILVGQLAHKLDPSLPVPPTRPKLASSARTAPLTAVQRPRTAARLNSAPIANIPAPALPVLDLSATTVGLITPEESAQIDRIREALERSRLELILQAVVRLPQRQTAFYESFSRLRGRDGTPLPPDSFYRLAAKVGYLPALDILSLYRCIERIRGQLEAGDRSPYFCNIAGATLTDPGFAGSVAAYLEAHNELRRFLIFELSEADFGALDDAAVACLARLTAVGYRLSLDGIESLDFDPTSLGARGVGFIKIAAAALLPRVGGEPAVDIAALKDLLEGARVALIVEKIETEDMLLELLDFGIDYGQGFLFGEPRKRT